MTTGRGRPVEHGAEQQAGAAHLDDSGQRAQAGGEPRAGRADVREQLVGERVADRARRRRTTTGLPPKVEPWSPGDERARGLVGDEQAADRQPVGERLGERHELRPDAELLEREERARAAHPALDLVEGEQRAELARRARAAACRNSGSSGITPPSPRIGSSRISPMSRPGGRAQRVDVVRLREADAGEQRLERGALRRLAGRGERAGRAAVEAALERDHARAGRSPCART